MTRLALLAALLFSAANAAALSAYVPGPDTKKKKGKTSAPRLQPSGVSLSNEAKPLTFNSGGGLSGPKEVLDQTAAPTSASGAAGQTAAVVDEKKGTETVPVKKAPPRLRGR